MKQYLGVDISDDFIRYVCLDIKNTDYIITKSGKSKIDFDLLTADALCNAIKDIVSREGLRPSRIFVSLSRKDTVIHQLMLPKLTSREFDEVLKMEIEKIPTFHKQSFDFIYKKYQISVDKVKVLLAAVRLDILTSLLKEVNNTKIPFHQVEIAPLNFRELPNIIDPTSENDAFLIMSDQQTYLGIFMKGEYRLIYKLAYGLKQVQNITSPEQVKTIVTDWGTQIKRVLKSFLMDNRNVVIRKIWLVWDNEIIPNFEQYIGNFDIPVEVLDARKIKQIHTSENNPLNPIYMLALAPIVYDVHQLKLQFPLQHFFGRFQVKTYALKCAVVTASILGIIGFLFAVSNIWINVRKNYFVTQNNAAESKITQLKQEASTLYQEYAAYQEVREQFLAQATFVQEINRISWAQVFSIVANELPQDLALTSFKFVESGGATINGEALNMESISEMLRRIEESAILDQGRFDFLREKKVQEQKLFNFGILAALKAEEEKPVDDKTKN
ncbi:MAG: pilus assembly protein PilM [Candidatus Omnitrophica bacterium]|nr:pilus assembly protein PilM [Candidatus Omnitrophota bacterium]